MAFADGAGAGAVLGSRGRRREVPEEVRLRTDKGARPPVIEAVLIGLHRAVEGEKLRVGAIGLGEDAVALAVALAADLLGLLLSLRKDDGDLAVRLGLDRLALLRPLRAVGGGALLPLGLHAAEYGLRVFGRQVGALDAHIDDGEAKALGAGDHLVADVGHQRVALVAHDVGDRGLRQCSAKRGVQHAAQLRVRAADVEDGLIKQQRIGDTVAHEGVDLQALIVGHQHFLALVVEGENALVDIDDRVDKRPLEVEARRVDEVAHRLTESQDERLFGRVDDKRRHQSKNDRNDRDHGENDAVQGPPHLPLPTVFDCNGSRAI